MTQQERLLYLIEYLKNESIEWNGLEIPENETEQKRLLRSLMNIRSPKAISEKFLNIQDEYLQEEQKHKKIVSLAELSPVREGIYLWQRE